MVPHGFENVPGKTPRCPGIFPTSDIVSTFECALQPWNTRVLEYKAMIPTEA